MTFPLHVARIVARMKSFVRDVRALGPAERAA
jgi:hypothetical protein